MKGPEAGESAHQCGSGDEYPPGHGLVIYAALPFRMVDMALIVARAGLECGDGQAAWAVGVDAGVGEGREGAEGIEHLIDLAGDGFRC
ncbi:hypothetical protein ACWEOG_01250 [Amycolatopsis japonica]